jgi:serine/threonine-protein kinase
VTLGTFDYISPEQARDPRNADVRSDMYSLGCTLYFMLTGRPPFPDGTVLQKLLQHQAEEPTDPRELRADLPEELLKILRRMLAKAPAQRYQQPAALMRDLLSLAGKYGLPAPATSSPLWPPAAASRAPLMVRHLPWLVPVCALLVAALIVAIANRSSDADVRPPPIRPTTAAPAARAKSSESSDVAVAKGAGGNSSEAAAETGGPKHSAKPKEGDPSSAESTTNQPAAPTELNDRSARSTDATNAAQIARGDGSSSSSAEQTIVAGSTPPAESKPSSKGPLVALNTHEASGEEHSLAQWLERRLVALFGKSGSFTTSPPLHAPWAPAVDSPAASTGENPDRAPAAAGPNPIAVSPAERKGVLVVSRSHEGPGEYGSLAAACRAAKSGEAIELRYSGRLDTRPINLAGQRLTIRAGDGFAPIVNFQPRESDLAQSHSMIVLGGGQITLINLQLELDVPRQVVAENLTLGEIRPGESVRLESCVLTIRNPSDSGAAYHPDVAFFEIRAVPGPGVMTLKDGPMMRPAASLQMKNCIARGEALFIRANELQPAQITWENGLLATSERLLAAVGGPSDPKPQGQVQIDLRHVTALIQGGLALLTSSPDAPLQLPLEINASDCIFVGKSASAPLVEQSGVDEPEEMRKRIAWNGDRNFYEGFNVFWRMGGPGGAETAVQMTLADWQGFWGPREIRPTADQVAWRVSPPGRSVDLHLPADYALGSGENPARNAASDGRDAGVQIDQLPPIKD